MANKIPDEMRASIREAMNDLHDSFARTITIFKREGGSVTISSSKNPVYRVESDGQPANVPLQQTTTTARIKFIGQASDTGDSKIEAEFLLRFPKGIVRLKVPADAYALLKDCRKIIIDDIVTELISPPTPIGPFSLDYVTVYTKRV